jgi:hypothetical protein
LAAQATIRPLHFHQILAQTLTILTHRRPRLQADDFMDKLLIVALLIGASLLLYISVSVFPPSAVPVPPADNATESVRNPVSGGSPQQQTIQSESNQSNITDQTPPFNPNITGGGTSTSRTEPFGNPLPAGNPDDDLPPPPPAK